MRGGGRVGKREGVRTEDEGEDEGSLVSQPLVEYSTDRRANASADAESDHDLAHDGPDAVLRDRVGDECEAERPQSGSGATLEDTRDDHGGVVVGQHEQDQAGRHQDERGEERRLAALEVLADPGDQGGGTDHAARVGGDEPARLARNVRVIEVLEAEGNPVREEGSAWALIAALHVALARKLTRAQ